MPFTLRKQITCVLIFALILIGYGSLCAQEARLTNITVSNTRDDLLLYLNLEGAFSEKLNKAILSGVPATFFFLTKLNRVRGIWVDQEIADITVTHTIKYDNLKKEFVVRRSWRNNEPEITKSFSEAQNWMTEVNSLKIIPLGQLEKGQQYQLRTKADSLAGWHARGIVHSRSREHRDAGCLLYNRFASCCHRTGCIK